MNRRLTVFATYASLVASTVVMSACHNQPANSPENSAQVDTKNNKAAEFLSRGFIGFVLIGLFAITSGGNSSSTDLSRAEERIAKVRGMNSNAKIVRYDFGGETVHDYVFVPVGSDKIDMNGLSSIVAPVTFSSSKKLVVDNDNYTNLDFDADLADGNITTQNGYSVYFTIPPRNGRNPDLEVTVNRPEDAVGTPQSTMAIINRYVQHILEGGKEDFSGSMRTLQQR